MPLTDADLVAEVDRLQGEVMALKVRLMSLCDLGGGRIRQFFWRRVVNAVKAEIYDRQVAIDHLLAVLARMREEHPPPR